MIKKFSFFKFYFFLFFGFIIIIFGAIITFIIAQNTRKNITTNLLYFSESVSAAINPQRVKTLTASSLDDNNPDNIRINQQLQKVQTYLQTQGIRWSYLVFQKDNQFLFSASSITPDDPGYSKPGDIYKDPPQELQKVFQDQQSIISQPYQDEWGKFVSAFIPIKDFSTGELLAVIGFDIDYQYLQFQINRQIIFPIISTIFIFIFYIIIFFLISRQLNQTKALEESEERFRLAVDAAIDPVIMMNQEGNITLWNKAAEKTYGYSQKEALGHSLHHLILPPKKYNVDQSVNLKNFKQTGQSPIFGKILELETTNKAGKIIPIELSVALIKTKNEISAFGIIRDISIRRRHEKLLIQKNNILKEEKLKTEALLSGIGDGVLAIDQNFKITYANHIAEKLLGWTSKELIGKDVYDNITVKDGTNKTIAKGKRALSLAVKSGKTISSSTINPVYYVRKDKSKFPVAITASPINSDGKFSGAIDVFRDITHEIEVDKMKNEFISLASHQLRTPLSAIKWYSEMLLEGDAGKLDTEQTKFIDNINLSNQRMIDLVNTLLNISRIESGRIIIESNPTDLKELISTVIYEFESKIKEKKQKIIVNINPNLKKINCDPKLIFEVYKNLISNAIKYSPKEGEIQIFVSSDKDNVISQITDNGYGIPKKDQTKVFTKFYRGENILKIETEGTGLGLYLIKSIIESSGGKIWFKSEENKGTTFWFSLPLKGVNSKKGEVSINS
ncbi:MAG: PAS domain S-box protein [Candidatus Shapirobacteria bacterium]|nr:PAS domain S-box protein [Candidatus Shapirobacteria bacterium]MDD3002758.1 PAS domain S-box protein [Candidatus Shapirobacteria bacterium]MDD4383484.1 PAS domain S-box protein [Candidatus Shapirobacteria bacterium]